MCPSLAHLLTEHRFRWRPYGRPTSRWHSARAPWLLGSLLLQVVHSCWSQGDLSPLGTNNFLILKGRWPQIWRFLYGNRPSLPQSLNLCLASGSVNTVKALPPAPGKASSLPLFRWETSAGFRGLPWSVHLNPFSYNSYTTSSFCISSLHLSFCRNFLGIYPRWKLHRAGSLVIFS